jgi:FkbM family methyltransferase
MSKYPYTVRKQSGETKFNFTIYDSVADSWYASPTNDILTAPYPAFFRNRDKPIGWLEMDLIREHIAIPGSTIIECGCHHGLTTILLAAWVGESGFVHAFDAVLANAYFAQSNLALNNISNAAVYCAALSSSFGRARLCEQSNVRVVNDEALCASAALTVPLSPFFDTTPDALKLDIEGKELDLLSVDHEFIARVPRLAIEVHTDILGPTAVHDIAAHLQGRCIHVLDDGNALTYYDRLRDYPNRCHLFSWPE